MPIRSIRSPNPLTASARISPFWEERHVRQRTPPAPGTPAPAPGRRARRGGGRARYRHHLARGLHEPGRGRALAPHMVSQIGSHVFGLGIAYSKLLQYRTDVSPADRVPTGDLAESWTQPDDATYLFKLRQDAKFQNI